MNEVTNCSTVVFCDFDGTITTRDTCDAVLTNFAPDSWREVDERFHRGEIGSRECICGQFRDVKASEEQVRQFLLDNIRIDPDFAKFVCRVEEAGICLYILSDGFELHVDTILSAHGFSHLRRFANRIALSSDGVRVQFPHARKECRSKSGNCKCGHIERLAKGQKVVLIGDGYSDRCPARLADVVFAKRVLLEHCISNGLGYTPYRSFADILTSPAFSEIVNGQAGQVGSHLHC